MDRAEETPAFVPGKILYIREKKHGRRIRRRYVWAFNLHMYVCVCVLVSVCMSASVCVFITRNITVFCSRHLYWYDNHFQRALNSSFGYSGYIKSANSRFLANSSKCRILVREQLSLWYLRLEHLIAIVIVRTIMIMKLWWESNKLCLIIINVFHGSHPLGTYYSSTW